MNETTAKSWYQLLNSEQYQGYSPEEKQYARERFRDKVLLPQYEGRDREYARMKFDEMSGKLMVETPSGESFKSSVQLPPMEEGVNYAKEITNATFRVGFSRMETDEERAGYLNKNIGDGQWAQDQFGNYIISPEGAKQYGIDTNMPIALDKTGFTKYDFADFGGEAPEMIGSIGMGIAASGYGAAVGIPAVGFGTLMGHLIDEGVEQIQGYNKQSFGEVFKEGGEKALMDMATEGGQRLLRPVGRKAMGPHTTRPFADNFSLKKQGDVTSTIEPERLNLVRQAKEIGGHPSLQQATDKRLASTGQQAADFLTGNPREKVNRDAILREKDRLIYEAGGRTRNRPLPTHSAGRMLADSITKRVNQIERGLSTAKAKLAASRDAAMSKIRSSLGVGGDDIGGDVSKNIIAHRQKLRDVSRVIYGEIDNMFDGKAVVPTKPLKDIGEQIRSELLQTERGRLVLTDQTVARYLKDIRELPEYTTAVKMYSTRTELQDSLYTSDLLPGISKRRKQMLVEGINNSLHSIDDITIKNNTPYYTDWQINIDSIVDTTKAKEAVRLRDMADNLYKEEITKFDDVLISRITRQAGKGGAVDEDEVIGVLMRSNSRGKLDRIKRVVEPKTWNRFRREYYDNILYDSTDAYGELDAGKVMANIKKREKNGVFSYMFEEDAPKIKNLYRQLAAVDGKIDISHAGQGDIVEKLKVMLSRQEQMDAITKNTFLKDLQGEGVEYERAMDFLIRPRNTSHLRAAKEFFGEQSQEWMTIRQKGIQKLLGKMINHTDDPVHAVIDGTALKSVLKEYSDDALGSGTIRELLGDGLTEDFVRLANVTHFLSHSKGFAGGLVVANIALHPITKFPKLMQLNIFSRIFNSELALKYLTTGITSPNTRKGFDAMTRFMGIVSETVLRETGKSYRSLDDSQPISETIQGWDQNIGNRPER